MKKRIIAFVLVILAITASVWVSVTYYVPSKLVITSSKLFGKDPYSNQCAQFNNKHDFIDQKDGSLNLLVWNIYKQNKTSALSSLHEWSGNKQLLMLQEVKMNKDFQHYLRTETSWLYQHVDAWEYNDEKNGVLTAATVSPTEVCGFRHSEPWLRLPKSSMLAYYPMRDGSTLAVANIHAINFTLGVSDYRVQVNNLVSRLKSHQGPIIFAGDFNSWSDERINVLNQAKETLGLKEVHYENGEVRKRFLSGIPLDHVFFRGLEEISTKVLNTDASDHSPIVSEFKVIKPL
ncbi:endonuclease/exonuclease/phosphatase family protein [Vibrio sp.]|nr:endonuclease/exonuclease/phosphatase family protein [Vibrio sp.]